MRGSITSGEEAATAATYRALVSSIEV
jgi:hypothetical protein